MLTKRLAEKATPADKPQKLADDRGLHLYVTRTERSHGDTTIVLGESGSR